MSDDQETFEMIMPLVVCQSNGGPYDDLSFVVGMRYAEINLALGTLPAFGILDYSLWVERELAPQLDLLAMHHGYTVTFEECEVEECMGDWVQANFVKIIEGESDG